MRGGGRGATRRRAGATAARAALAGAAVAGAAVVGAALGGAGCGGKRAGGDSGGLAAAGLAAGLRAAADEVEPWRCARGDGATLDLGADPTTGRRTHVAIAVVADARAADDATVAALGGLRRAFAAAGVAVVFADGDMGASQADLEATLGALVDPAWTVVALPGAEESVPGLRGAIAALRGKGAAIVDGSATRELELGVARVVTLPGEAAPGRLAAGADGCVRTADDVAAAVARLGSTSVRSKPIDALMISTTAPRGGGDADDDLAPGGVHAGELDLARALRGSALALLVHPAIGAPSPAGAIRGGTLFPGVAIATGVASAAPRYDDAGARLGPGALIVTIDAGGIRWQPVAPASPAPASPAPASPAPASPAP